MGLLAGSRKSRHSLISRAATPVLTAVLVLAAASGCSSEPSIPTAAPSAPVAHLAPTAHTVSADGCGLATKVGAGFPVRPDLVMTVAHTLRGARQIDVDGITAVPVVLDHRTDIAVLRLATALPGDPGEPRQTAAEFAPPVIGPATLLRRHTNVERPETVTLQVTRVAPINIEEPIDHTTYHRDGLVGHLAEGVVTAGDSGSPVVNFDGAVLGMVFATDTGTGRTAFAVSSAELQQALSMVTDASASVDTGRCPD